MCESKKGNAEKQNEVENEICKNCELIYDAEINKRVIINIVNHGISKRYCIMWLDKDGYIVKMLIVEKIVEGDIVIK
ncbi:MAG: hypothetical protein ACFFDN_50085 [Candidatus Hodarchaeota archaeon]